MERLVIKSKAGSLYYNDSERGLKLEPHEIESHQRRLLLGRLHAYEDIGLTPEQIRKLQERDTEKAPVQYGDEDEPILRCPHCDENVTDMIECGFNFCPYCGGRWEE